MNRSLLQERRPVPTTDLMAGANFRSPTVDMASRGALSRKLSPLKVEMPNLGSPQVSPRGERGANELSAVKGNHSIVDYIAA